MGPKVTFFKVSCQWYHNVNPIRVLSKQLTLLSWTFAEYWNNQYVLPFHNHVRIICISAWCFS